MSVEDYGNLIRSTFLAMVASQLIIWHQLPRAPINHRDIGYEFLAILNYVVHFFS